MRKRERERVIEKERERDTVCFRACVDSKLIEIVAYTQSLCRS